VSDDKTNPIDLIAARLDGGRRWSHGNAGCGTQSECLVVATRVLGDDLSRRVEISNLLGDIASEQFPDRTAGATETLAAIRFNDHEDTVFSDIEDVVLPKARQLYEDRLVSGE
jgi:hypothetical protein